VRAQRHYRSAFQTLATLSGEPDVYRRDGHRAAAAAPTVQIRV
jgi:hypothetical protein